MQHARGFIVGCTNGWLPRREAEHPEQQIGQAFMGKKTTLLAYYIRVTKWLVTCLQSNPIGTNGAGFCSNLGARGLFSSTAGFYWVYIDWLAPGHLMGAGNPTISRETRHPSPGRLPAPAPAAPHSKTYFSASKTNKKNNRHMNYRHW